MPHFSQMHVGRDGRNYATMMMPGEAKTYSHYAMSWWSPSQDILQCERDAMEELCAKVGGEIRDFSANEVKEASEREGYDSLAPVGAQYAKKLCVLVFDL